jgi:Tol biopolymer transport system component
LNPRLVELLRRCLEKNPKKRWHAAADVRVEIEALIGRGIVAEVRASEVISARPLWKRAASAALFALAGLAIGGLAAWTLKPSPPNPVVRFSLPLPDGQVITPQGRQAVALSPDGTQLVYVANGRLFVRTLSTLETRPIPGSESAGAVINPTFSPDGQSIAFRSDASLKRIALNGGAPVTICPMEQQPYGISWHDDGIVFSFVGKGVLRVSPNGGVPEPIASAAENEVVDAAQLLPAGRGLIFSLRTTRETWDQARVVVQPLGDDGKRKTVIEGGADARYLPTGHLVYTRGGVIFAVPFDLDNLSVMGGAIQLVEGVRRAVSAQGPPSPGVSLFAVSQNGTLVYVPGPVGSPSLTQTDLGIFDAKGAIEPLKLAPGPYRYPRVSSDGKWVAFESGDEKASFVSVYEIGGATVARRLTFDNNSGAPLWSLDGNWVVFTSDREGARALYRTRADGSGTAEPLTTPEKGVTHAAQTWTRDGQLVFSAEKAGLDESRLFLLAMSDRKVTPLGNAPIRDAAISPDGRWIAYGTRRPDAPSPMGHLVFVEPFPQTGAKYLLPQYGGHPIWTPKGDALITNTSPTESHITPVVITGGVAFEKSVPFPRQGRAEANPITSRRQADILPDGRLIGVLSQGAASSLITQVVLVLNWFEEIRQRVQEN